ncbi:MAG TPA: SRPBCC family protein [Intrasporangium sp.]|nr:SRPBCC family protein [Intrasporangium sp.]
MTTTDRRTGSPVPRPGLPWTWGDLGSTPPAPECPGREVLLSRAVRIRAEAPVVFGWLGQLRVAPYSYDLIDNRGRRSPQTMTRTDPIETGQAFAEIFTLTSFEPGRSITLELTDRVALLAFGPLTILYRTLPDGARTVLRCDLMLPRPRNGLERLRQLALAWGDLVMMRRQLLNLRRLSERTASLA